MAFRVNWPICRYLREEILEPCNAIILDDEARPDFSCYDYCSYPLVQIRKREAAAAECPISSFFPCISHCPHNPVLDSSSWKRASTRPDAHADLSGCRMMYGALSAP